MDDEWEKGQSNERICVSVRSTGWTMRVIYISEIGERAPISLSNRANSAFGVCRFGTIALNRRTPRSFDILEHTVRFIYRDAVLPCSPVHKLLIRMAIVADWFLDFHHWSPDPKNFTSVLHEKPTEMQIAKVKYALRTKLQYGIFLENLNLQSWI